MMHFEIPPYLTPPRNEQDNILLDDNMEEKDQEVLEDLDYEEQQGEV